MVYVKNSAQVCGQQFFMGILATIKLPEDALSVEVGRTSGLVLSRPSEAPIASLYTKEAVVSVSH